MQQQPSGRQSNATCVVYTILRLDDSETNP
jgi:hypothetical protein